MAAKRTRGTKPAARPAAPARVRPTMKTIPQRVSTRPSTRMETFPNPHPGRDYEIEIEIPEFTCLCPMTAQPDFAVMRITYIPNDVCVELKSLRNYLWTYREQGTFHEDVTNRIADDLIRLLAPRWLDIEAEFQMRGGIATTVRVSHGGAE